MDQAFKLSLVFLRTADLTELPVYMGGRDPIFRFCNKIMSLTEGKKPGAHLSSFSLQEVIAPLVWVENLIEIFH